MPKKETDLFKKSVEAPAQVLEMTVDTANKVVQALPTEQVGEAAKKTKNYWRALGPGLTTGASDDDPSGIATYSQAGAQFGYRFLWLAAFTFPLMAIVQEMCARIGLVTGRGLAGNIRTYFSRRVLYVCTLLLFAANAFNIGADLGAMAKGAQLLAPGMSFPFLVIAFALVSLIMQIYTPYERYARYLKWLALVLLAYVASAILAHLNWGEISRAAIVPKLSFSKDQILIFCAILGTTISPYLFFWQTSQEVEEQVSQGKTTILSRQGATKRQIKKMRMDVWSGMLLSNIVMFFIIAACGAVLFKNGVVNITSAAQAAEALRPFAGNATYWLFAIGIIGTGFLAIPVLAGSSSYALSESLGWRGGLNRKLKQAYAFYGTIIMSMLVGLAINFIGIDPFKALIYSAVANGLVAPIVLLLIVLISRNQKIMGKWVNKKSTTALGWVVVLIMAMAGVAAIYSLV